jgi:hypothetical protein
MLVKITEQMQLELTVGKGGARVDSIVQTGFGGNAWNQVFWSKNENEARAFIQGVQMMAALQK